MLEQARDRAQATGSTGLRQGAKNGEAPGAVAISRRRSGLLPIPRLGEKTDIRCGMPSRQGLLLRPRHWLPSGVYQACLRGSLVSRAAPDSRALCGLTPGADLATAQSPPQGGLTPDQQAIVDQIARPAGGERSRYAGTASDVIGTEVTLPLGNGQFVTLVRTGSVLQKDGSVVWHGEVPQTGERAMLMLWSNALLTGIEEANETFKNIGIGNVSLRLVHTQLIEYDETEDDQFTHLYTMVDGIGPFNTVRKLGDDKRADIVGLIIDNPTGCGLSTRIGPTSDEAFFVVHHACPPPPCRSPTKLDTFWGSARPLCG
jgi:hypothetical protein